jgi:phage terminase large subunit
MDKFTQISANVSSTRFPLSKQGKKTDRFGIPLEWERVIGMDVGLRNPTAAVFGAIDPKEGELVIYNEYYKANTLVPEHAKNLKPLIDEIHAGRLRFMKIDPSAKNKTDPVNGKSIQGLFQEYGMFFSPANNHIEAGILKVNSYVERGKIKIYHTCVNTVREHLGYKFPELDIDDDKNPDEKPLKKDEHSCDALRYLCMALPDDPELLKTVAFEPKMVYNSTRLVENEYGWDGDDENYSGDYLAYV